MRNSTIIASLIGMMLPSCETTDCNDGCGNFVAVTAQLTASATTLSNSTITLCRNGMCSTGVFSSISPTAPTDITMAGSFNAEGIANPTSGGTAVTVQISGGNGYSNGDVYELMVVDATGMTLFEMSAVGTYDEKTVCGTQCQTLALNIN